jgi:ribosomal protein S18
MDYLIFGPGAGIRIDARCNIAGSRRRWNGFFSAVSSQKVSSVHSYVFGSTMNTDFKDTNSFKLFLTNITPKRLTSNSKSPVETAFQATKNR